MKRRYILIIVGILIMVSAITIVTITLNGNKSKKIINKMDESLNLDIVNYNLKRYADDNIKKVTQADADYMIQKLQEKQEKEKQRYYTELNNNIQLANKNGEEITIQKINENNIKYEILKNIIKEIKDNGYIISERDGCYIVEIDYYEYKNYEKYVSNNTKEYINILNDDKEVNNYNIENAKESIDDLDRLEVLYKKTQSEGLKNSIANSYKEKVNSLINPNTNMDYSGSKVTLNEEYKNIFNDYLSQNKQTKLSDIVSEYINLFEKPEYNYTTEVKIFYTKLDENKIILD